jgi:hypothetical protein
MAKHAPSLMRNHHAMWLELQRRKQITKTCWSWPRILHWEILQTSNKRQISRFCRDADEMWYYAALWLFLSDVAGKPIGPSSRVKNYLLSKTGPTGCPATSVRNCHSIMCNIPEEHRPQSNIRSQHCSASLCYPKTSPVYVSTFENCVSSRV